MKKNDWILLAAAVIFSILFYQQRPGLNFFIFTSMITALILLFNPEKKKDKNWWYYAILCNLCGSMIMVVNSVLSIFATVISLLVLSGKSFNKSNSVFLGAFFSFFSLVSAVIYWVLDRANKVDNTAKEKTSRKWQMAAGVILALLFALFFFFLYRSANPLFADFTAKINLDWISFGWLFFTFFGFIVMRGLILGRSIKLIADTEVNISQPISAGEGEDKEEMQFSTVIAITLFAALNLMLLFLNGLDVVNLFFKHQLPNGITLSDFVHQSVWATVFSILVAVTLIMWFFKGELNFNKHGRPVKYLVFFWILQSTFMVIDTMVRNYWYTNEYTLTYLRIGVYVFLSLSLIGLGFTIFKIAQRKSAWALMRDNFETWFLILALSTCINWDNLITDYNISHAGNKKVLDKTYLLEMSDSNLPQMMELFRDQNSSTGKFSEYEYSRFRNMMTRSLVKARNTNWQSFNLRDQANAEVFKKLKMM
jgi:hypothetical protein